ncbi:Aminomethyltransferase folate-binding domain-containing protein [Coemansia reversa NRRL 1564]|uniref:Aminomethyltransferase folate-binding domain-containing protein n=1 Tax=Coemansia reversa (strain ATCC 12441 / NRRL 1564) TaxID=763665 RepID=A0A2G5BKW5_COERN|nr:Aminomethyltransferase folate-binding domain-containing protein [Coemansia reversa NRRL 1564]|eukprot:PIA19612.1 Aminomethyltransferase folate-binding domain-containing protein [Coemansia reversa NRRL 1564]
MSKTAIKVEQATDFERVFDGSDRYAAVEGRGLIEVSGSDATEFLQGMQCNHIPLIEQGGPGMLTGFLTPQGRMMADAFVYPRNMGVNFPHPVYLIEVDARVHMQVQRMLDFYKLRAQVRIRDATSQYAVWSVWGPHSMELTAVADVWAVDGRAPGMGLRLVVERGKGGGEAPQMPAGFELCDGTEYRLRRILKGVAEGADDFVKGVAVALETNLDYMQGVHFGKGCYVGQELTIRTHHRGVVRKRVVPVLFGRDGDGTRNPLQLDYTWTPDIETQADITRVDIDTKSPKRERRVPPGKVGSIAFNAGLALMRLEQVEQYTAQQQHSDGGGGRIAFKVGCADKQDVFVSPWSPSWWPDGAH